MSARDIYIANYIITFHSEELLSKNEYHIAKHKINRKDVVRDQKMTI